MRRFYRLIKLNPADVDYLFFTWFLVVALVFGFYGITSELKLLEAKNLELTNLKTLLSNLNINSDIVVSMANEIHNNKKALSTLNSSIPAKPDESSFALSLSVIARRHGYNLVEFLPTIGNGNVVCTATFSGYGDLSGMLSEIELQKRLTRIKNVQVIKTALGHEISMLIETYFAGGDL